MLIKEMSTARETRQQFHGMTFSYELEKYPFREELEKLFGIELISHALNGVNEIAKKITPATKTAPKAACGV